MYGAMVVENDTSDDVLSSIAWHARVSQPPRGMFSNMRTQTIFTQTLVPICFTGGCLLLLATVVAAHACVDYA